MDKFLLEYFERALSQEDRDKIPTEDFGDPESRTFPVRNQDDVDNAARLLGHAPEAKQAEIKRRISEIAKRKNLKLPQTWQEEEDAAAKGEEGKTAERLAGSSNQPTSFTMYTPFTRVTSDTNGRREVLGRATRGMPIDKYGTIIAYEGSKRAFERAGHIPVREMHNPKAVGKGLEWTPLDEDEDILLRSYISRAADDTWTKVEEGILTGYSVKGVNPKYGTMTRNGKSIPAILDYDLIEVSLVDNPACPGCDIAILRADGMTDVLASPQEIETFTRVANAAATTTTSSFERVAKRISAETQAGMHDARNSALHTAKKIMDNCGCDECSAASKTLDPDGDGDIDFMGLDDTDGDANDAQQLDQNGMMRAMLDPVVQRMQAILTGFARSQQPDTGEFERAVAGMQTQFTTMTEQLGAIAAKVEQIAKLPQPGGPNTGKAANKQLATDPQQQPRIPGPDSPLAETFSQLQRAGVQLTPQQSTMLVASGLKRL